MIEIREIDAEDTYPIRRKVLRKGMTISYKLDGDHHEDTLHLGAFEGSELRCIASFMRASNNAFSGLQYQLRGMATAWDHQGKGLGKIIVNKAEEILVHRGAELIWCNARVKAMDFYSQLGYAPIGNVFDVPQVGPHYVMFKKMSSSA